MTDKFTKLYISLKYRLSGAEMWRAMQILEMAKEVHDGLRKDKVTPEFQHQIEIALYAFTLKWPADYASSFESLIIVCLLHDLYEDYPHQWGQFEILVDGNEKAAILFLNKNRYKHFENPLKHQFEELSLSCLGSLVKGMDRINNFQSMNRGNFSLEKQIKYAAEVSELFLPMLKKARKLNPILMDAYFNIENMLKCQHELISLFIAAKQEELFDSVHTS